MLSLYYYKLTWTKLIQQKDFFVSWLAFKSLIFDNLMQFDNITVLSKTSRGLSLVFEITHCIMIVPDKAELFQCKEFVVTEPLNSKYVSISSLSNLVEHFDLHLS